MNIEAFCADIEPLSGRFPISKPWVHNGWKYATDIRIAVREMTDEPDSHAGYPDVEALFAGRAFPPDSSAWKVLPTHDGKGKAWTEPACIVAADPPKSCKAWGNCPASPEGGGECTNEISGLTPGDRRFEKIRFGGPYLKLLNDELPGVKYYIGNDCMRFMLGDVEGVLARMKH